MSSTALRLSIITLYILSPIDIFCADIPIPCVTREGPHVEGTSQVSCSSSETLVSCGWNGNGFYETFKGTYTDGTTCSAVQTGDAITAKARCCSFPSDASVSVTSVDSSTSSNPTVFCSDPSILTGCHSYYISGNIGLKGAFPGPYNPPQTDTWGTTPNQCNAMSISGGVVRADATCLTVSNTWYTLHCETRTTYQYGSGGDACAEGYYMLACMAYKQEDSTEFDFAYVETDHTCYARQDSSKTMYRSIICCKLSPPTPQPTTNPTLRPTSNPTQRPTPNPTLRPTLNPTPKPTPNPTPNPTANPTSDPTTSPSLLPSTDPSSSPTPRPTLYPSVTPTHGNEGEASDKVATEYTITITFLDCDSCESVDADQIAQKLSAILSDYLNTEVIIISAQRNGNTVTIITSISLYKYMKLDTDEMAKRIQEEMKDDYGAIQVQVRETDDDSAEQRTIVLEVLNVAVIRYVIVAVIVCVVLSAIICTMRRTGVLRKVQKKQKEQKDTVTKGNIIKELQMPSDIRLGQDGEPGAAGAKGPNLKKGSLAVRDELRQRFERKDSDSESLYKAVNAIGDITVNEGDMIMNPNFNKTRLGSEWSESSDNDDTTKNTTDIATTAVSAKDIALCVDNVEWVEEVPPTNPMGVWSDYIAQYGHPPQSAQYLQKFCKTNPNHKALSYKEAKELFDDLSTLHV